MSDNVRGFPDWVRSWLMAARGVMLSDGYWIIRGDTALRVGLLYDALPDALNDNGQGR